MNLEIRELYPKLGPGPGQRFGDKPKPEPTMAELDAMIAEQLKPENLPPWWHNDFPKADRQEDAA